MLNCNSLFAHDYNSLCYNMCDLLHHSTFLIVIKCLSRTFVEVRLPLGQDYIHRRVIDVSNFKDDNCNTSTAPNSLNYNCAKFTNLNCSL